jgi:hypothetical protein
VEFGAAGAEPAHAEKEECPCLSAHPNLHFSAQRVPAICNQREYGCEIDAIDMEVTLKAIARTLLLEIYQSYSSTYVLHI